MRVLARVRRASRQYFLWRAGRSRDITAWSRRCDASAVRQVALLASCTIVRFIALFAHLALIFI